MEPEKELDILEYIYHNPEAVRQRDLAEIAGVSLGMINVVLKRFATRGWIKVRKINNRTIHYVVSPAGLDAISKRSYSFFKRTIKNLVYYKDILEQLVLRIKRSGHTGIVLVGGSEVDFLVEHFCVKHGLLYCQVTSANECTAGGKASTGGAGVPDTGTTQAVPEPQPQMGEATYYLFSEEMSSGKDRQDEGAEAGAYLRDVLIG